SISPSAFVSVVSRPGDFGASTASPTKKSAIRIPASARKEKRRTLFAKISRAPRPVSWMRSPTRRRARRGAISASSGCRLDAGRRGDHPEVARPGAGSRDPQVADAAVALQLHHVLEPLPGPPAWVSAPRSPGDRGDVVSVQLEEDLQCFSRRRPRVVGDVLEEV